MTPLPPPSRPPDGQPPIVATRVFADEPDATLTERARIAGGRLVVEADPVHPVSGQALLPDRFRDIILDVSLALETGSDEDRYGVYLRQTSEHRYVVFGITPTGRVLIALVDAQESMPLVDADLAPDMPFAHGVGAENRITVVSIGPSLTFMLNGAAVTGITVDPRYQDGVVGAFVQRAGTNLQASIGVRWVQVRAVLADQPPR
jgi:hypothetical protein